MLSLKLASVQNPVNRTSANTGTQIASPGTVLTARVAAETPRRNRRRQSCSSSVSLPSLALRASAPAAKYCAVATAVGVSPALGVACSLAADLVAACCEAVNLFARACLNAAALASSCWGSGSGSGSSAGTGALVLTVLLTSTS